MLRTSSRLAFVLVPLFAFALFFLSEDRSRAATIRIMPLGDSITAGYTDNPTWNVPFGFGYRSGLYQRLTNANYSFQFVGASGEPWNGVFGVPKTVTAPDLRTLGQDKHRGYGGWGIQGISDNISSWLAADNPDVILLMIGINDIPQGGMGNPTTVETKLDALVGTIVNRKPNAHLIVAQIIPYAASTEQIVNYNKYIKNTLVPKYAKLGKNVTTVDQYSNFLTSGGAIDSTLYSNGINHPNAVAYDRMAQTWFTGIQAVVPEPSSFHLLAWGLMAIAVFCALSIWKYRLGRNCRRRTDGYSLDG